MLNELRYREKNGQSIQVVLIGAGAMGLGIAWQIGRTPGMEISAIVDKNIAAVEKAEAIYGKKVKRFDNAQQALDDHTIPMDVLVESSNSIEAAADFCLRAIARKAHVILMNAEIDLVLGPYLQHEARKQGVVVTSDAGDQHGVLMRMIDEIEMWGFDIVQAGNIKGFLDRYATAESKREIAKKLHLNLIQCVAYTDGTKLNIEMALIANAANLTPFVPGMEGPRAQDVTEALNSFDFDAYQGQGRVDYLLGAKPGGGVYVIGKCDDEFQAQYLNYYKVQNKFPYYLFYRPYHLCHLETTRAIALAALYNKAVLTPQYGRLTDCFTYAKQSLPANTEIQHGIGGDEMYGMIRETRLADTENHLPIGLLTAEGQAKPRLLRAVEKDQPILITDVELPDNKLRRLFTKQQELLANKLSVDMEATIV